MESILKLFEIQTPLSIIFQIGVDVIILGLLVFILTLKRPRISKKDEEVMRSFEKIMEETAIISQSFEVNLEKRQELLQQITARLDQRIMDAKSLCARLERSPNGADDKLAIQSSQSSLTAGPRSQNADQQKVLSLARKGMSATEIAKSLKRPAGEIELILDLQKIAS